MGPRIILRGAIPIDSNIGGSGHRPLLGEVVSRGWSLLSCAFLFSVSCLCRLLCLLLGCSVLPKVVLQMPFPSRVKLALSWGYGTTVASHGTTAGVGGSAHAQLLPRGTVLPLPSRQ